MNSRHKLIFISNITVEPVFSRYVDTIPLMDSANVMFLTYEEFRKCSHVFESADIVVVCLNFDEFYTDFSSNLLSGKISYESIQNDCIHKCGDLYSFVKANSMAHIIWFGFEDYYLKSKNYGTLYVYDCLIDQINIALGRILKDDTFIDLKRLIAHVGIDKAYDIKSKYRWNTPYSKELISHMADEICKQQLIITGCTKKCLILDCDNVLWGGVLSEDGVAGIQIGASGLGRPFQDFQKYLLDLYYHGVILTVCSKNDKSDVLRIFREHSGMILKEEHIAVFQCGWDNKPSNIIKISEYLNIGINSMVFVDDSDFEIESVKSILPEITAVKYNRNTIYEQLSCFNLKNSINIDVIRERNNTYKTNVLRNELKAVCLNLDDYIRSLVMQIDIHLSLQSELCRISELTLRTNRCTNGKRYTLEQLKMIICDDSYALYTVCVSDKFSSLGIVGTFGIKEDILDLFSLSCRALGRSIEERMIEFSCTMGASKVDYKSTGKNEDIHVKLLERLQPLDTGYI